MTAQVDANSVLRLPLGKDNANKVVRVIVETVERAANPSTRNRQEWLQFIANTTGKITDPTFKRHPEGEYELRDELRNIASTRTLALAPRIS